VASWQENPLKTASGTHLRQRKKGCDLSQPFVFVLYYVNIELTLGELEILKMRLITDT
jgi:hypothetical protein